MTRHIFVIACAVLICLLTGSGVALAQSNCSNTALATVSSSTTVTATPAYAPFSGTPLSYSFNITVQNGNPAPCSIGIILLRPTSPIVMTNGSLTLGYGLDFNGNNVVNIGSISSGYFLTAPANSTGTFSTFNLTIPANQTSAAAGRYSDNQIVLYLYAYRFGWRFVRTYSYRFGATINKTCTMSAASPSLLNFTSAISRGIVNPSVFLSSNLSKVNCTSPAKITIAGSAMMRTPSIGAISGFDNFINWRASAKFGSATAILATNSASTVTSTSHNVPSGSTVGGSFGVDVNLIAGQRLRSGDYSSVLTVTVDPTL